MQKIKPVDRRFMARAIELARRGQGRVSPNPLVGAVLVKGTRVLGEGAHTVFGGPHAEVNAIRAARHVPRGSTLYVNLEPCAHFGKTPPCTDLLLSQRISRVVVGMKDPNPLVSGRGLRALRNKKVRVDVGVLGAEAAALNKGFLRWVKKKIPYVTAKIAQSLDGSIAYVANRPRWISGKKSRTLSHALRALQDAILVGVNTVLKDDPRLDIRHIRSRVEPVKVILDSRLRTPSGAAVFSSRGPVWILTTRRSSVSKRRLLGKKAEIFVLPEKKRGRLDWRAVLRLLGQKGVTRLLIEGGGKVLETALAEKVVDEMYVFVAPVIVGRRAPRMQEPGAAFLKRAAAMKHIDFLPVGKDLLIHGVFR